MAEHLFWMVWFSWLRGMNLDIRKCWLHCPSTVIQIQKRYAVQVLWWC